MAKISDLHFDDKNFNKHTEFGMGLLEKSLRENGAGRSILIDKDNNIIAGNGIVEAAGQVGLEKIKVVETTGDEIVAVKRTDLSLNSEQGRTMALADNATANADLEWDTDALADVFEPEDLGKWGVNLPDWDDDQSEYSQFVDKFKPKLTTDDCFTPPKVFKAVEKWVREEYGLGNVDNIRPFKPEGDYQSENYDGKVVIDNPPFSILSEIIRWYTAKGVKFFLFAPYLSTLNTAPDCQTTKILTGAEITYENGAKVLTNFVTNMASPEIVVKIAGTLRKRIEEAQPTEAAELERYKRPKNLKVGTDFVYVAKLGHDWELTTKDCELVKNADELKAIGKVLYGGGLLISDKVAEKAAAEKAAITVELSEREKAIVARLNGVAE